MGSSVEVGAVISDLETEYERSKKFLDELYASLQVTRVTPGDPADSERPPANAVQPTDKEAGPEEPAPGDPLASFAYSRADSGLCLDSSDYPTSVPHLPELRAEGRSPSLSPSPAHRNSTRRREDAASAAPSTPKKKSSLAGTANHKKPPTLLVSCPVLEITDDDDPAARQPSSAGGGLDGVPQRPGFTAAGGPSSIFASLDSAYLAQVLTPSPLPVPTGRHRRSSLDFIPAPPAHLRKWYDNTVLGLSPGPTHVASTGQLEVRSSLQLQQLLQQQQQAQPGKTRSLEVLGGQPTSSPLGALGLQPTTSRPPQAQAPASFRRGGSSSTASGSSNNTNTNTNSAGNNLQPTPPPHAQHPQQHYHHHQIEQHTLPLALDSPNAPTAFTAAAAHLARGGSQAEAGPLNAGGQSGGSPSSASSPNLLPPLQLQPSVNSASPLGAFAAIGRGSIHSSIDLSGRGSWNGASQSSPQVLPSGAAPPEPSLSTEHSPRDRARAARFIRCSPSPPTASSHGGHVAIPTSLMLSPMPPPGRERRTLTSDGAFERLVPRTQSLLSAAVLKASLPGPHAGRGGSFRTGGLVALEVVSVSGRASSGGGTDAAEGAGRESPAVLSSPVGGSAAAAAGLGAGVAGSGQPGPGQTHGGLAGARMDVRVRSVGGVSSQ